MTFLKKKKTIFFFVVVVLFFVIIAFQGKGKSDVFWTNYWTVAASIITAILAILGIIFEINSNKLEKKKEEDNKIYKDSLEKYEENLKTVNQEGSAVLVEWWNYLNNNNNNTEEYLMKSKMIKLLYQYSDLENSFSNFYEESEEPDVTDYYQERILLRRIVNHKDFKKIKEEIEYEFRELEDILKLFSDNPVEIKHDDSEVQKANSPQNIKYPDILGDWTMKEEYAKKANYLVGISIKTKEIIAIYQLDKHNEIEKINNRVRFSGDLIYDTYKINSNQEKVSILQKWTSRNPVLYYNMWSSDKTEEDSKKLLEIIKKYSVNPSLEFESERSIVVVKTNQYDSVDSSLIREKIPFIFEKNNTEKMSRQDLINELKDRYPYLEDHEGVYQGVFNKLETPSLHVYNVSKEKRLIKCKNESSYEFISIKK